MAARRPKLIKVRAKAQKKTKTEQYLINYKGFGEEPVYTSKPILGGQLSRYYTWYNAMCDVKEAKEYLKTYLKNTGRDADVKRLRDVPDKWIVTTAAWTARMISQGANLPEDIKERFEERVREMLSKDYSKAGRMEVDGEEEVATPKPKVQMTVQDKMKVHLEAAICEIEHEIDKFGDTFAPGFNMYEWLQAKELPAASAKKMHEFYNPQLLEIEEAFEGVVNRKKIDEQLKEGYEGYGKEKLTKLFGFYVMIVEDLEQYMSNSKKERKPRAKKPISSEKKLKDFKHLAFDNTKKIQSIQPIRILGASELWTFNTKYNQLTVFRTTDPSGLDVHRTAITNFDPATSHTKKLRQNQVDAILKRVADDGKVGLRSILKDAKGSDQKLQERMNENTLLLRVLK